MSIVANIAEKLRCPRRLATRAVIYATGLLIVSACVPIASILFVVEHESARRQLEITGELTEHLASAAGNLIAQGDIRTLTNIVELAASRAEVRRVSVRDPHGETLAEHGGEAADIAAVNALAARVAAEGQPGHLRSADGGLALGAPIMHEGGNLGVAVMMWDGDAYRFQALASLAPLLLLIVVLIGGAVLITARAVRSAMRPLDQLARFAGRVAARGEAATIDIKTGDEFEALADAFNNMTARLDASVRQYQDLAFVDPATRLPNQDRFAREVDLFILRKGRESSASIAVLELQRLPRLLQSLDPDAAPDFLRVVADKVSDSVRTVDRAVRRDQGRGAPMTSRLGAAEFGVFTPGVSPSEAARLAQLLNAAVNQPFEWRGHKFSLGACCGVALAPRDGDDAGAVIRHARLALVAAQSSATRVRLFTQSLDREAAARLTLEREMRSALERNEFRAFFQPKVSLLTGRIEGCEALARWIRPDRTIIGPARFIPVAEDSGLIGPLSDAIMREACWKAAAWARGGFPVRVAVNVSALQFRDDRFAENVLCILRHAGLPPSLLELEITESMVMEDPDRALRAIRPLRQAGVRLAIDDFGCGHSSLAALSKLPFDVIKIDQQFVRAIERGDAQSAAIVDMILALGRTLHMEVVAEGVERREEVAFMAARGCRWAQGFLYGAALPAQEFAEMLRRQAESSVAAA